MGQSQNSRRNSRKRIHKYCKERGICYSCKGNKAVDGKTNCKSCTDKNNKRSRRYHKSKKYWKVQS